MPQGATEKASPLRAASRNDRDLAAERLRREAAVPPDAERAPRAVEGHHPAQDLEAVLAGPHHPGSPELGPMLRPGGGHQPPGAGPLGIAVTEPSHPFRRPRFR